MDKNIFSTLFNADPQRHRKILKSLKAKADARRSTSEILADWTTAKFGSVGFLIINVAVFTVWILINLGKISSLPIFDPYPFNLLTMAVSLEAIILAIFVLISQNRSAKVDDLREETHMQINLIAEKEVTKALHILLMLAEKYGIDLSQDPELQKMLKPISATDLERMLEKEIS